MLGIVDLVVIVASIAASGMLFVWTVLDVLLGVEWLSAEKLCRLLKRRFVLDKIRVGEN